MNEILIAFSNDGTFTVESLRVIPLSRYREVKTAWMVATLIPHTLYPTHIPTDSELAQKFAFSSLEGGII